MTTVNARVQTALLRRAALSTRHENALIAALVADWRRATAGMLHAVRSREELFTRERALLGVAPADRQRRLEHEVLAPLLALLGRALSDAAHRIGADLQAFVRRELHEVSGVLQQVTDAALASHVQAEAAGAGAVLSEATGVSFDSVPVQQVSVLLSTPAGGSFFQTGLERLGQSLFSRARGILLGGLVQGRGVGPVARDLQGALGGARYSAERIVRSEYVRSGNQANLMTFEQNKSLLDGVMWNSTLDRRTCIICAKLDGRVFRDVSRAMVPVQSTHPNCLLPWVRVEGAFLAATRMRYDGPALRLRTRAGHVLTVTPNHPVLTARGLLPARELRERDDLVRRCCDVDAPVHQDEQDGPATIEQVYEAIAAKGFHTTSPRSGDHFHGDAARGEGDVDVVAVDRALLGHVDIQRTELQREFAFVLSDVQQFPHTRPSALDQDVTCIARATASSPGTGQLMDDLLAGKTGPLHPFRIGLAAELHAALGEATTQHRTADTSFVLQVLQRLPGAVALDELVEIRDVHYSGHVYDLQSESGFILAEDIVISNCRCLLTAVVKAAKDLGLPPGMRASFDGQVPATATYRDWFGRQGAAFQREVLGPARYRLWSSGALKLGDFVTAAGVKPVSALPALTASVKAPFSTVGMFVDDSVIAAGPWETALSSAPVKKIHASLREIARQLPAEHWRAVRAPLPGYESLGRDVFAFDKAVVSARIGPERLGQYGFGDGIITINSSVAKSKNEVAKAFVHEFGHAMDRTLGATADNTRWTFERVSEYAKENAREAFAEAYAMFASPRGRTIMRERFPGAYGYMERVFGAGRPVGSAIPRVADVPAGTKPLAPAYMKVDRGPADYLSDEEKLAEKFARSETPAARAARIKGKKVPPEEVARIRRALGMDEPVVSAKVAPTQSVLKWGRPDEGTYTLRHDSRTYRIYHDRDTGTWRSDDLVGSSGPGGSPVDFVGYNRADVEAEITTGKLAQKMDRYLKPKTGGARR